VIGDLSASHVSAGQGKYPVTRDLPWTQEHLSHRSGTERRFAPLSVLITCAKERADVIAYLCGRALTRLSGAIV
jgi:hypothetical protein